MPSLRPDNAPLCTTSHYQHSVSEAALPGTMLLRVAARDPDLSSSPRYTITGQGSNRFSVDATNGKLSILKRLDRERHADYTIKVRMWFPHITQFYASYSVK